MEEESKKSASVEVMRKGEAALEEIEKYLNAALTFETNQGSSIPMSGNTRKHIVELFNKVRKGIWEGATE